MKGQLIRLLLAAATIAGASPGIAAGDVAQGRALFRAKCQLCHVAAPGQSTTVAPNLWGVIGRKAAVTNFPGYSRPLKAYGQVWTPLLLDSWLKRPSAAVPGTYMAFDVPSATERSDIIAYMQTLKK